MKPEHWQKLDELFHAALELDGEARAAFLAKARDSDAELGRELESMLAHHHEAKSFMESPAYAVEAEAIVAHDDSPTLIGKTVGRYEIRAKIGAGGMGEVYLAQDTELDRPVALKFLSAEVAADQKRLNRFLQEARAASALSHPNVAHIYEIGEADNVRFIAMEFVEGEGLDKRISGRPLGVGEILDFGVQIADALDQAHAKGITHR